MRVAPPKHPAFTVASFNTSAKFKTQANARIKRLLKKRHLMIALARQEPNWATSVPAWARKAGWRTTKHDWRQQQVWHREAKGFAVHRTGVDLLTNSRPIEASAAGPTNASPRKVAWVAGDVYGRNVVIASVHLTPSVQFPLARALNREQVIALVAWAKGWQAKGYEVVILGDFNFLPFHTNSQPLWRAGFECINHDDGWTHRKSKRGKGRTIDHCWISPGLKEVWSQLEAGHRADDHRILVSRIRFR